MLKMGIARLGTWERGTGLFINEGRNRGLIKELRMMRRRHGRAALPSAY